MKRTGVYILKGSRYYVGSTSDLEHRLKQHAMGHTYTTKRIGSWTLACFIECKTMDEARKLEGKIKRSKNIARWIEQPRTH
ncbi:GIY-YIG nuclease family protein [Candidatus Peregrinibacteria bacterium]|nr:GIY-YIG nuclease family protein [Candidatus Peregrinibacteria bacterium]